MDESVTGVSNLQSTLSFEQQKELLLLQMEHEKLKQRSEGSKLELERARLEVETLKLKLAKEEGRVCLVGEEEIPVKILRDTGSMDSFILESVLPFSSQSHTGESVLIRGIGLNVLSVPLHKVSLQSELIQGEVVMGVRPALPIEGVHIILGNGLVEEFGKEQRADSSLDALFQCAVTPAEMSNLARGYVVSDGVLLRKWIPHKGDFVGDPVFQVVVPVKFRCKMIEIAHDQSGHQGVRKTYDRLLRYYFWPRLKSRFILRNVRRVSSLVSRIKC
ncbi:uncharacterized protein LOC131531435 isoform X3 [Onychostoma macrolepis]|uniref:uncharacterized protein LOC131531435 isoform X3 n=1 Tax=Onychostoma macrolepis TaxID=369639 RepID=UPI00272C5E25|nr:uncharacterized protein LOC131531435 isoform X3 [Onychostoma macrolepis]